MQCNWRERKVILVILIQCLWVKILGALLQELLKEAWDTRCDSGGCLVDGGGGDERGEGNLNRNSTIYIQLFDNPFHKKGFSNWAKKNIQTAGITGFHRSLSSERTLERHITEDSLWWLKQNLNAKGPNLPPMKLPCPPTGTCLEKSQKLEIEE